MRFRFKADTVFEAADLEDAFGKLASHFVELAGTEEGNDTEVASVVLEHVGEFELKQIE